MELRAAATMTEVNIPMRAGDELGTAHITSMQLETDGGDSPQAPL